MRGSSSAAGAARLARTTSSGRTRDVGRSEHFSTTSPALSRARLAWLARLRPQLESREEEEEARVGRGGLTGEFRSQYWCVGEPRVAAGSATREAPRDEVLLGRHDGGPALGGSAGGEPGDHGGLRSNRCQGGVSN